MKIINAIKEFFKERFFITDNENYHHDPLKGSFRAGILLLKPLPEVWSEKGMFRSSRGVVFCFLRKDSKKDCEILTKYRVIPPSSIFGNRKYFFTVLKVRVTRTSTFATNMHKLPKEWQIFLNWEPK